MAGLSQAVKSYRMKLMRDFMRERELDALCFTTPDWFEWAANNEVRELAWERPYVLVVTADGASFAVASEHSRFMFTSAAKRGALWIDEVYYYSEYPEGIQNGWILPQWEEIVRGALVKVGSAKARLGADALSDPLARVGAAMAPDLFITSAGREMRRLRWCKHAEELDAMRTAAALSDGAFRDYRELLKPGCLLAEVDWLVGSKLAAAGAEQLQGQNFTITSLNTASGVNLAGPKGDGAPTGKRLADNAIAISTIVTRLNGVTMEVARPWIVGRPSAQAFAYLDCAYAAQRAAIDEGVAGRPVRGMHQAAQRVIEEAGFEQYFPLRAGHGIGVVMHDFPEDLGFNDRPLLANETYAIEPGLLVPDLGGFRYGDIIAVGAEAPDVLTKTSTERTFLHIA